MKKLISTSLAFLSIVTSSASFPNQLSAIENKSNSGSNIKFYLKRASNILCTILPAFIASAIFKSRTQPQTSIIPEKKQIEEIKKQGEDIKEQIEKIKKQIEDLKEQIGEDIKEQGKDIKEQIEAINNRAVRQQRQQRIQREQEETQAKERQANLASSLTKKNVSRDQIQIVDLTEDSFNIPEGTKAKNIADNMKNYYTRKFARNQEGNIKYMIWSKLKEQNVTSDNLMNKIYKYNNSFYKILGCADLYTKDDSQEINFPFNNSRNKCLYAYNLIRATLYYNHDFGNPLVISLVPYNVNLAAQV